ncbi:MULTISPECIES: hypothetical protein [Mycetohabitans]|uniref:hypothetical protein n=1 Tax=Mycetohabitans TaxID=2571159 RepID=UPI0012FED5FE|nr:MULTISPECIES: hypothetical protein [Mycetohabitans]MCF7697058.1 hypothetical protein [Mycetohabitans sp. B2]MCG1048750.1 hypothetical protein [Mycetohabitans sp. B6]
MKTILWMLRFQFVSCFIGAIAAAVSGYILFVNVPATDNSAPWVAAHLAFGVMPWTLIFIFGCGCMIYSWWQAFKRKM